MQGSSRGLSVQRDFNSIKVRLEPEKFAEAIGCSVFQFHKGTIRTEKTVTLTNDDVNFNSIKVRLEPILLLYPQFNNLFQFHKGTIRTR